MMLGMIIMMGQRAAASAERIYEILDEEPDRRRPLPAPSTSSPARATSASSASSFAYAPVDRVRRRSLSAASTSTCTSPRVRPSPWSGRTGSGKSTVARLLTRFYDVDGGAVRVDGHDVRDVTLASLRSHIGVVLDEPFLFSVSIRDNIAYGEPDGDVADVVAAAVAAGADEFIRALPDGYDTVVGERGYTLSGGQRQRIAIARTLLVNPPILVLDDATSAIDVQVEQQIHDALRALMKGRTTLIIAHRLSTISLADRVVLLDERPHRGRRHPRRAAGDHPALRRGARPGGEEEADAARPTPTPANGGTTAPVGRRRTGVRARRRVTRAFGVVTDGGRWAAMSGRRWRRAALGGAGPAAGGRPALRRHPVRAAGRRRRAVGRRARAPGDPDVAFTQQPVRRRHATADAVAPAHRVPRHARRGRGAGRRASPSSPRSGRSSPRSPSTTACPRATSDLRRGGARWPALYLVSVVLIGAVAALAGQGHRAGSPPGS